MRAALDGLKSQSDECFAFTAQAKASLPNVEDLRIAVDDTIKSTFVFETIIALTLVSSGIEPLLNDDGHFYKTEEARRIIGELHMDYDKCTAYYSLLIYLRKLTSHVRSSSSTSG